MRDYAFSDWSKVENKSERCKADENSLSALPQQEEAYPCVHRRSKATTTLRVYVYVDVRLLDLLFLPCPLSLIPNGRSRPLRHIHRSL